MRLRDIFFVRSGDELILAVELSCVATIMSVCKIGDNDKLLCFKCLNLLKDLKTRVSVNKAALFNCFLQ